MALAYAGEDYEDTAYKFEGTTTEGSPDHWKSNKFTLGLPFPNLPYYIDGDVKLSQSNAILRHVGRKHNLYGKDANEASEIDMLIDTAWDVCNALIKILFADFVSIIFLLSRKYNHFVKNCLCQIKQIKLSCISMCICVT